jgi:arsenate reductase (glutaredoxin)
MIIYGLSTCDTCKKAQKALVGMGHDVTLRDVRAAPLTDAEIAEFITEFGSKIINTQSTTYRGLSDWMKNSEADHQLREFPALMKRPVIRHEGVLTLGWDEDIAARFS